jgi:hypothetical protein
MTRAWLGVGLLLVLCMAGQVRAVSISIPNGDFESPATLTFGNGIANWTQVGNPGGVWNINADPCPFDPKVCYWTVPAPDGNQVGFLASGGGGSGGLEQALNSFLTADTLYTLTGWIGTPATSPQDLEFQSNYTISLLAVGTDGTDHLLSSLSSNCPPASKTSAGTTNDTCTSAPLPPLQEFSQFVLSFDSSGSPNFVGDQLEIRLSSDGPQTAVDALALTAEPIPVSIPEPATLALLGVALAGIGLARRRDLH